ncbi:DUF3027 domain-containing protein [Leucobacter massiliensis]|uniref:Uncharacterized protein n=1 Tax=Leucobacter massiliensis TaxID=1686285 RepID=A0A2S9QL09_9MICO|nr:DUF3027 domain-containing protein [Leucobacter massiliensis]PRI10278.1 hypothetical protein B4915_12860 [Leucobacter massiliensis]
MSERSGSAEAAELAVTDEGSDLSAEGDSAPSGAPSADEALLAARDQARSALAEITDPRTVGADDGHEVHEDHVLTLFFECRLPGYPGWRWAATLARVDEGSPVNVLEVELLPGPGAVVAPEWVPWSVRLAQYRESQARQAADEAGAAEAAAAELADDGLDEDDILENDFSDFDDEIDGVELEDELGDAEGGSDAEGDEDSDPEGDDGDDSEDRADEADDTELFDDEDDDPDDAEEDDASDEDAEEAPGAEEE